MNRFFLLFLSLATLIYLNLEGIEKMVGRPGIHMFHKDVQIHVSELSHDNEFVIVGTYFYKISPETRDAKREKIYKKSKEIFLNLDHERTERIPHISHRMWITKSDNPKEAPQDRLELYIRSLNRLDPRQNWQHMFWCVDKKAIPETVKFIENSGIPIEIHEVGEIYQKMRAKHLFDAFYQNNLISLAADVLKQNIVYLFGGVYSDIGLIFHKDITPYLDAYDYIFISTVEYIDQSFFGYKKHDTIFNAYLNNLDSLYRFKEGAKVMPPPYLAGVLLLRWVGPAHLTAAFDNYCQESNRVLFVPMLGSTLVRLTNLNSWIGATYGNKKIYESHLDIFSIGP